MEAIILAGGFGTRLQSVVKNVPKPMADINGQPFLVYLLEYLILNKITKVVLSVGYKKEIIEDFFGDTYKNIQIVYSKEETPLGTGGAIRKALTFCNQENVFVINGDTFLDISLDNLRKFHYNINSNITLALVPMENFCRYGSVDLENERVISFNEKKECCKGLINGGIYIINSDIFDNLKLAQNFSFEDYLSANTDKLKIGGFIEKSGYFIDIGIPEDYKKALNDFKDIF